MNINSGSWNITPLPASKILKSVIFICLFDVADEICSWYCSTVSNVDSGQKRDWCGTSKAHANGNIRRVFVHQKF